MENLKIEQHRKQCKYNPETAKRARDKFRATHHTERLCKCCGLIKPVSEFDPRKHYCKECDPKAKELKAIKLAKTTERIPKVKIKMQKTLTSPKRRNVRKGWIEIIAKLKLKFETNE